MTRGHATLGWGGIFRLGLVQTALGGVVVLTTSTINRAMVVELALPATLPGLLVGFHYAIQLVRPRMGYGSDVSARRTPWILGGMVILAIGGLLAALSVSLLAERFALGLLLSVLAFFLIGIGVAAAGTSLLALLASRVLPRQRAGAATLVWLMMIAGFAVTAGTAGRFLDPFSPARLVTVAAAICVIAVMMTALALWRLEPRDHSIASSADDTHSVEGFRAALAEAWADPTSRRFTIFVFASMLAYSAQDLVLEPFTGEVFGLTIGESTSASGLQHGGVFVGMLLVAFGGTWNARRGQGSLAVWTTGGCLASAVALLGLVVTGEAGLQGWLRPTLLALGVANGAFAAAAIAMMMQFAGRGRDRRAGTRMGLWGAAQAIAFGLGGFAGTVVRDLVILLGGTPSAAYATVFLAEAALFLGAAALAMTLGDSGEAQDTSHPSKEARTLP